MLICRANSFAAVAELADARDLKSREVKLVPVRSRSAAPRRRGLCIVRDDFSLKSHRLTHAVAPPFRKKSRSAHLLGCKRPRDGSLSLPTFRGV